ncbi:MAG: SDR family NAD(P)-dependent oxidoreductase [Beijerinckiaceae bacterium]
MKTALVTGSSSGIGRAIAVRLLSDGWRVTGLDRAPPNLVHPDFEGIAIDLTDADRRRETLAALGVHQVFVHAAGVMRGARLGDLDLADGELLWRIHVDAAIAIADHLAPTLPRGGRIVMIGSRAIKGVVAKSQYGAAKAALVTLAKAWAKELVARGITVNVVSPAATETAMLADPGRTVIPPETPPMGRRIRPEEIASLVAYLLSAEADAITGQDISICGGASL